MSWSLRPSTPPSSLSLSTNRLRVLACGSPRKDAGPVADRNAPILIGSCAMAGAQSSVPSKSDARVFFDMVISSCKRCVGPAIGLCPDYRSRRDRWSFASWSAAMLQLHLQPAAPRRRAAAHHPLAGLPLGAGEDEVPVVDFAFQHAHLARAAQALLAVALDVDVGFAQDGEDGLVGRDLQRQAGIPQLHLEGVLPGGIQLAEIGDEVLEPDGVLRPVAGGRAHRVEHPDRAAGVDLATWLVPPHQGGHVGTRALVADVKPQAFPVQRLQLLQHAHRRSPAPAVVQPVVHAEVAGAARYGGDGRDADPARDEEDAGRALVQVEVVARSADHEPGTLADLLVDPRRAAAT